MRKLKLDVGALRVESFEAGAASLQPGTVKGREDSELTDWSNCNCTLAETCDVNCTYDACEQVTANQQTCFAVGCLGGSTSVCSGNPSCEQATCVQTCSPMSCGDWFYTVCC